MKHIFSIFYDKDIILEIKNDIFKINDSLIYTRIINILRLKLNDQIVIFNDDFYFDCFIFKIEKKEIILKVIKINEIKSNKDKMIFYMPIIEKDYMEEAFRGLVQNGINEIRFVRYEKSYAKFKLDEVFIKRIKKIMIATAEQCKQYDIPKIDNKIYSFSEMNQEKSLIWFNDSGKSIFNYLNLKKKEINLNLTCGPEGGFTENEIKMLRENQKNLEFSFGKSVYRSCDVINFVTTFFRSI